MSFERFVLGPIVPRADDVAEVVGQALSRYVRQLETNPHEEARLVYAQAYAKMQARAQEHADQLQGWFDRAWRFLVREVWILVSVLALAVGLGIGQAVWLPMQWYHILLVQLFWLPAIGIWAYNLWRSIRTCRQYRAQQRYLEALLSDSMPASGTLLH